MYLVAFVDDMVVIVTGHNTRILKDTMSRVLEVVTGWMKANGLMLSVQKWESVILISRRGT